jgi:ribosomal protein L16/L10AE
MAKLVNSSLTSYSLATPKDFKAQHLKAYYSKPIKYSDLGNSFYLVKLKSVESGVFTYDHFLMFNKFINKFKFLKKISYLRVRPYLNATKKPAEVRMGKGKGKFDKKIAPIAAGTDILEIRIARTRDTDIEDWSKRKAVFLKDSLPALRKLSCKLPVKTVVTFNDL